MMKTDKQYKHKLNMLEPGGVMIKIIVLLLLLAFILYLLKLYILSALLLGAGVIIFLILIFLLAIEQHQDRMLYEDAKKNDKDIK